MIPIEILKNQFDQTNPYPGDGGIRYEPKVLQELDFQVQQGLQIEIKRRMKSKSTEGVFKLAEGSGRDFTYFNVNVYSGVDRELSISQAMGLDNLSKTCNIA